MSNANFILIMELITSRLVIREFCMADLDEQYTILSNPQTMRFYPAPFSFEECEQWIQRSLDSYRAVGYGLWAVTLKGTNRFIGDCGITMQNIDGQQLPEIGYHINDAFTCRGYATEAACACRNFAFDTLDMPTVYSYQSYLNIPSRRVAEKIGMRLVKRFPDSKNKFTTVYAMSSHDYHALK